MLGLGLLLASSPMNGGALPSRVRLITGDIHTIVPDRTTGQQRRIEMNTVNAKLTGPSPNQQPRRQRARNRSPGIQVEWNPTGTRWGICTRATGPAAKFRASITMTSPVFDAAESATKVTT
jgi:hypothetical protein